jgi:hypothetical protein
MAVAGTLDLQWRFGRMFLDYMNPAWPKGALVFVADVPLNPNNAPVECEFVADVPTMQELMAAPVDPNLTLGQNVLAYCEDLMRRKGGLHKKTIRGQRGHNIFFRRDRLIGKRACQPRALNFKNFFYRT